MTRLATSFATAISVWLGAGVFFQDPQIITVLIVAGLIVALLPRTLVRRWIDVASN
ncbi:hypothetical protein CGERO_01095 [Corynebacterium gerontici]|uniref:Uncharacterized protein n=1 Tax=Corynebacterium gerontici TaxID=2079234 RepID=A0A3G6J366_9CORY|nr:hypothetical protein CGERO_01095 [Corynebacterium gerontici]